MEYIALVKQHGKYGYIGVNGEYVIPPQYAGAEGFAGNLAMIRDESTVSFIDKQNRKVLTLDARHYLAVMPFSEGYARLFFANRFTDGEAVRTGDVVTVKQIEIPEKVGYMDSAGKVVLPPAYDWADDFHEGLAAVALHADHTGPYLKSWQGSWGFIDQAGKVVIALQYQGARAFSGGLAAVSTAGCWGYIDKSGAFVIKQQFDAAENFSGNMAVVKLHGKYGVIGKQGALLIPYLYDSIKIPGLGAVAANTGCKEEFPSLLDKHVTGGSWSLLDQNGKPLGKTRFTDVDVFSEDLAFALYGGHYGVIDPAGNVVIRFLYDDKGKFAHGLAPVCLDKKWGYINKKGEMTIAPRFEYAGEFAAVEY